MTDHEIPTTPIPPAVDAARRALAAVLDPDPTDRTGPIADLRLVAAEALAVLSDVQPPYPPLPARLEPTAGNPLVEALIHLEAAIDQAASIQELTRIATAALVLRRRGGVAA